MNFIRKFLCFFLIFIVGFSVLNAQVAADPNDSFYEDALRWELQGIIPSLPEMRPYSLQLIKSVLEYVMTSDDYAAASKAKEYYEKYFEKPLRFGLETNVYTSLNEDNFDKQLDINPVIYGNAEVLPNTTISFEATPILSTKSVGNELIPEYTATKYDSVSDNLKFSIFNIYTPYNAVAAFGSSEIYFQAGLNRNSFGNILDTGIVIGATAPHVGSMVFTINKEKFNYQMAMFMLSASDSFGEGRYPSKYFYLHSLRYAVTDKFDFTIYETALTGPRFDFTYLMPIVPFMAMQQISGYSGDNLLIGIELAYKPVKGLNLFINGYADDIGFNDLVKLQFNTKLKMAVEAGLQYAPSNESLCKYFSLDYTFLAPYMYTHEMYDNGTVNVFVPNYQNYLSSQVSFGSMLEPNSDRLRFNILLQPMDGLKIGFESSIARHGNINETYYKNAISGEQVINSDAFNCLKQYVTRYAEKNGEKYSFITDGSILDFPHAGKSYFYYPNHNFLFLENTTNYVCVQNSLDMEYTLNLNKKGYFIFGINYTLQYEKNVGVGTNMFEYNASLDESASPEDSVIIAELNNQYSEWESKLHDEWKNFVSFSVKYVY
ncbi:MAG: hypothetical protein UIH41_05490 [Treponemataceae bacterium]|nr:hypothetical protein [Treponemataceae bacterium]